MAAVSFFIGTSVVGLNLKREMPQVREWLYQGPPRFNAAIAPLENEFHGLLKIPREVCNFRGKASVNRNIRR
jgi:hypothetical protein